jgi:hypothetical protein
MVQIGMRGDALPDFLKYDSRCPAFLVNQKVTKYI